MAKIKEEHLDLMTDEKLLTQTAFGIVTSKRVIYYSGKKWFKSGSRKDVPTQHITSVGHDIKQSIIKGIFLIIIGIPFIPLIIGIIWIIRGIFNLIGYPIITLNTSGQDKSEMIGKPSLKVDADKFASSLRSVLFNSQQSDIKQYNS